jgi:hypothetical protein
MVQYYSSATFSTATEELTMDIVFGLHRLSCRYTYVYTSTHPRLFSFFFLRPNKGSVDLLDSEMKFVTYPASRSRVKN